MPSKVGGHLYIYISYNYSIIGNLYKVDSTLSLIHSILCTYIIDIIFHANSMNNG